MRSRISLIGVVQIYGSISDQGRFNAEFGYIPREDSWVNLYMKGISDLSEEELDKDYPYIPKELWEERVRVKNS